MNKNNCIIIYKCIVSNNGLNSHKQYLLLSLIITCISLICI